MHLYSIFHRCTRRKSSVLLPIVLLLIGSRLCKSATNEADDEGAESVADLEVAASESNGNLLTSESHKVIATGWPSTSSMWPTIDIDQDGDKTSQWFRMIEPFIYADKPRTGDYSLLLKINSTVLEALRSHLRPMSVSLSFEYYFNHEPKSTALPLIKIEVNRKELKYLDPNGQNVRARRWMKFNERIQIADLQQLEKPDWLKISLVNRDVPSIVAVRRLKADFSRQPDQFADSGSQPGPNQPFQQVPEQQEVVPPPPPSTYRPVAPAAPPYRPVAPAAPPVAEPPSYQPPAQDDRLAPPSNQRYDPAPLPQPRPRPRPQPTVEVDDATGGYELVPGEQPQQSELPNYPQQPPAEDLQPAASADKKASTKPMKHSTPKTTLDDPMTTSASELLSSTIKPVTPAKKKGWGWPGKRRRRRDTASDGADGLANASVITLACQRSDNCEWLSDTKDEGIQWSLARMPSSTQTVQAGYYYVSNRNNYGDSSKLLRVSLNQTERATIADQNSDHCLDVAIYVTERTFLRMHRLTKREPPAGGSSVQPEAGDDWLKGSLLMSWAPTMAINDSANAARLALPGSRLAAMESGQNGWTMETLCFGDFFANSKECGAGKCAFGFVMDTNPLPDHQQSGALGNSPLPASAGSGETTSDNALSAEQVVGISILREFSQNVPLKANGLRPGWLQTWQRDEVEPGDEWKFYPKLDYQSGADNVSLANLFNDAHYFIQSDWLNADEHLDFTGSLILEDKSQRDLSRFQDAERQQLQLQLQQQQPLESGNVFTLRVRSKLVDASFNNIFVNESSLVWNIWQAANGTSSMALNMSISEHLKAARGAQLRPANEEDGLFKIVFELVLDLHWISADNNNDVGQYLNSDGGAQFRFSLLNVSVSDRCYPNRCEHGSCLQNGTGSEDWNCKCDDKYRGRRCEFGHWCQVPHVIAWNPAQQRASSNAQVTLKVHGNSGNGNGNGNGGRQPKAVNGGAGGESVQRVSGEQYCKSKLGAGYKCTDIDLALSDMLYFDEDKTFYCSCRNEFYLSDDSKCRQTHACHSILCPSMGMICDDTRPFNQSQPCHCNEKQDWFPNPVVAATSGSSQEPDKQHQQHQQPACVRRQCHDKQRDCGFDAHLCMPTLPGEKPICKCGPKFSLKTDEKTGKKYCQSMACVLPTLNDCEHICVPDNSNTAKPYTCACHPGFQLGPQDGRSCKPERTPASTSSRGPHCRPACPSDSQICTELGCRCKQGFVGEGELKVRRAPRGAKSTASSNNNGTATNTIEYTESIRCLNICSLSYAENKLEFEMIESVCPLGLCDPASFQCKCSDPSSASLANEKYEPIYANCSSTGQQDERSEADEHNGATDGTQLVRVSPLCHLKRVCEPDSSSYRVCRSQGAICVPDYTKAAKFDCICPPSTEKRYYGQATSSEFTCESKCSFKKSDCLRKQAVCKQIDRDQVSCDCLPGFMLQDSSICYLAKYSYSLNLMVVNKYYEPEARFHRQIAFNYSSSVTGTTSAHPSALCPRKRSPTEEGSSSSPEQPAPAATPSADGHDEQLSEILPQFNKLEATSSLAAAAKQTTKSIFIADYNQCNISQVIPKSLIEDPYEHDIESYLGYIEQCNEKIHQNMRNYHLNSRLGEDIRQSLRQHLRDFTVTTNNSSCREVDATSGMLLNCTIYLQSNEPIDESTVDFVFNDCDKNAHDSKYCWIKPRLLLLKQHLQQSSNTNNNNQTDASGSSSQFQFRQIVPCEIGNFCGLDAVSVRLDDKSSLCSCKCPADIEVVDVKDLEPRRQDADSELGGVSPKSTAAVKEICAPRNHCGANSTHCLLKPGSVCQYDIRTGSRCTCVYPAYEDSAGKCVEFAHGQLDNTLTLVIIMLGTALLVSVFLNILVAARTKRMFGRSKQYPLNEFSSPSSRPMNRSTGVPNPVFEND